MPILFNGVAIFGDGPGRVVEGPAGQQILSLQRLDPTNPGSKAIGAMDPTVTVRGRLVGADDADLAAAIDTARASLTDPPTGGTLTDHHGRAWPEVTYVGFAPAGPVDRGRAASLEFTATFVRFLPR